MLFGALPSVLKAGKGMAPFVVSLLILACKDFPVLESYVYTDSFSRRWTFQE
jgi:hypothetical protein